MNVSVCSHLVRFTLLFYKTKQLFDYCFFCVFVDMEEPLTVNSPMATVIQAMQRPDSGLEIRDRMWLKITIPNAFIGTDMIDWLLSHVEGFQVS